LVIVCGHGFLKGWVLLKSVERFKVQGSRKSLTFNLEPLAGVIKSAVFLKDYHKPLSFLCIGIDKTGHPGRDDDDIICVKSSK
jgi:hypothetical protein